MSGLRNFVISSLLLLIVVFAALFVSFNEQRTALWLFMDFAPRPLGWWLILSFVGGGFLGLLLGAGIFRRLKTRRRIRRLKQEVSRLEAENARLRALDMSDLHRGGSL